MKSKFLLTAFDLFRIACSPSNPFLEHDAQACISQPGCYFDKELYAYRNLVGQAILPGVPVCHLAIRNRAFIRRANEAVRQVRKALRYYLVDRRPGAMEGHFWAVPPKSLLVPPKREISPPKKVEGPVPLECISGPVPPQNTTCVPPTVSKVSIQDEKHE